MSNKTPKKHISLRPKIIPVDETKQPPRRHIEKLYSPPPSTSIPPKVIHQPLYHYPPRMASPPLPSTNQNISIRSISAQEVEASGHRPSISATIDIRNRIPPLAFKRPQQAHSPRIVDSIVITKSQNLVKPPITEVFKEKQVRRTIDFVQKFPSSSNLQPQNSPRRDITASKLIERQLPVRYQPFKDRYSEKNSDSLTNMSDVRAEEPVKVIPLPLPQPLMVSNETVTSSANKLSQLTKKMEEIVKINQRLEQRLQEVSQTLIEGENENKKVKKKIAELNERSKQTKRECQRVEDETMEYRSRAENEIDQIKIQYGSDLFKAQSELNSLLTIRNDTETSIATLQHQDLALENEIYEFRELFKSIQSGFSQVNI